MDTKDGMRLLFEEYEMMGHPLFPYNLGRPLATGEETEFPGMKELTFEDLMGAASPDKGEALTEGHIRAAVKVLTGG